jgi:hypothetical protein
MSTKDENEFSFWTSKKKHAVSEILLYAVMIIGIGLGILIFS